MHFVSEIFYYVKVPLLLFLLILDCSIHPVSSVFLQCLGLTAPGPPFCWRRRSLETRVCGFTQVPDQSKVRHRVRKPHAVAGGVSSARGRPGCHWPWSAATCLGRPFARHRFDGIPSQPRLTPDPSVPPQGRRSSAVLSNAGMSHRARDRDETADGENGEG